MEELTERRRYVEGDYAEHIKPYDPLTMPYAEYLKTPEWKEIRRGAIERADHKCQLCGKRGVLFNVHHNTYDNRGAELDSDLIVLCVPCHEWYHGIREDQADRLTKMEVDLVRLGAANERINQRMDNLMLGNF